MSTDTIRHLSPIDGPTAWRGDDLQHRTDWIYQLSSSECSDLETVGERFVADDPDLRTVTADAYPLAAARAVIDECARQMDRGLGFVLVRGLDTPAYGDTLAGAIFYVMGLHLGQPMEQNQMGNVLDHVIATSNKSMADKGALPSRVRDRLRFHSDSSDVVALMCLRPAREGGASSLASGTTIFNEILRLRPDLAPLLFDNWYWDWRGQDPDARSDFYVSPICSHVDGVFSTYAGTTMIKSAQKFDGVPVLTQDQLDLLDLYDEVTQQPGLALDMNFQPGDTQWLLNYAALHSRTAYQDWPEPERRRHLLRRWLKRDVGRPLVAQFGKPVSGSRPMNRARLPGGAFRIGEAVVPNEAWGN